jgi:predicted HicB family RNase H-like nuclease
MEKKQRGRPRVPEHHARRSSITVRLTDSEHDRLIQRAREQRVAVTDLVRRAIATHQ